MARYKDYRKGDRNGSVRMFGYQDSNNCLSFKYEVWLDDYANNEQRIPFPDSKSAEKYIKKLGFKEW